MIRKQENTDLPQQAGGVPSQTNIHVCGWQKDDVRHRTTYLIHSEGVVWLSG
jgi:hypothetical protein